MATLTSIVAPSVLEVPSSRERLSNKVNRRVTDEWGFLLLLILMFSTFGISGLANYISTFHTFNGSNEANEQWKNKTCIDSSIETIFYTISSINATIHVLDNSGIMSKLCDWHLLEFCDRAIQLFSLPYIIYGTFSLIINSLDPEYNHHCTFINWSKVFLTGSFMLIWNTWPNWFSIALIIPMIEVISTLICLIIQLLALWVIDDYSEFDTKFQSVLRFYTTRRYTILFNFLKFLIMVFLMAWPVVTMNYFCLDVRILLGILFLISFIHVYGEMVIMLVAVLQKDQNDDAVSLKIILTAMITIIRYHIGTIVANLPFFRQLIHLAHMPFFGVYETQTRIAILKYSQILTAVYGHSFEKAEKTVFYFYVKGPLTSNNDSKLRMVWKNMLNISIPFICLTTSSLTKYVVILVYMTAVSIYFYVIISPLDTAEKTIKFCEMMKDENFEVIEDNNKFQEIVKKYKFQKKSH